MSATLEPPDRPQLSPEPEPSVLPDASVLEDKTPEWSRMSAAATGFVFGLGVIFVVLFANRPLWHSDLWDHVNYGNHILNTQSLPQTEPLLPLAEGVRFVPVAWASQVALAKAVSTSWLGLPALQSGHGLLVIIALAAVGVAIARRGASVGFAIVGYLAFLAVNWQQFLVIRPQVVGVTFYCVLLATLTTKGTRSRSTWILLPLMFVAWANCHGSFAVGLTLIALFVVGEFLECLWRTKSVRLAASHRSVIRNLLLLQLCIAAALLNPAGLAAFYEVLQVGSHPNIASMFEWDPLTLRMKQGQVTAVALLLLMLVLRISPRRLRAEELVTLIVTGAMALWSARMLNWFAPVLALSLGIHGAAAWRQFRNTSRFADAQHRSGLWTVVSLGLCWIAFGLTALGTQVMHGKTPELRRSVSRQTPVEAAAFLASLDQLPAGLAFAPAEWAGYLMNTCPQLEPMVNLHVHVIPEEVWSDYLRLANGPADWNGLLDRYGINLVITDKQRQDGLTRQLRSSTDYHRVYEDHQAVIFEKAVAP